MHHIRLFQQAQRKEELVRVCTHSPNVEPDVFAEALDDFSEVHAVGRFIS